VGNILFDVMTSGRGGFLRLGLLLICYWVINYCGKRPRRKSVIDKAKLRTGLVATGVLGLVIWYCFYIAIRRHEGVALMTLKIYSANWNVNSDSAIVQALLETGGDGLAIGTLTGLYYYSHQLSALDAIVNADISPDGFGRTVLSWPLYQLSRTGLDLQSKQTSLAQALYQSGENPSGFQTGFNMPIADFGVAGSIVFVLALAVPLGVFCRRASSGLSEVDKLVAIWMLMGFIWCIQNFPSDGFHSMNQAAAACLFLFVMATGRVSKR
jgi:hypothetical protein